MNSQNGLSRQESSNLPSEPRIGQNQPTRRQGLYWLGTIPSTEDENRFTETIPQEVAYLKGQKERGNNTGYIHWQVLAIFKRKVSLRALLQSFPQGGHWELTRSSAANDYVWKDDTCIEGSRFEMGRKPIQRDSKESWDDIWKFATSGDFLEIPADIRVINALTLDSLLFFTQKD